MKDYHNVDDDQIIAWTRENDPDAMDYLMNTPMKVSEIADAVGYDSVDHFSRTFRKIYGVPPQEYKKAVRLSGGADHETGVC